MGWITVFLLLASCGSNGDAPTRPPVPETHAIWRVPADFATIQPALDAAADGDTVLISPGVYQGTGNRDLEVSRRAVCVVGIGGPDSCIVDCGPRGTGSHFFLTMTDIGFGTALVRGLTIRNCDTGGGAVVCGLGPVDIQQCIFEDNRARMGTLLVSSARAEIADCVFRRNAAQPGNGGGAEVWGPNATFKRCTFEDNSAVEGGAIYVQDGVVRLVDCLLRRNFVYELGGALKAVHSSMFLERCTIVDNRADWSGGAIYLAHGAASIDQCTIAGNSAFLGGGFDLEDESGIGMTRSVFWGNCTPDGADIYFRYLASVSLESCAIDSTRIGTLGRCLRGGDMVYADPLFCSFEGCRKNGDFRLRSNSPCRLAGGAVLGSRAEECP